MTTANNHSLDLLQGLGGSTEVVLEKVCCYNFYTVNVYGYVLVCGMCLMKYADLDM